MAYHGSKVCLYALLLCTVFGFTGPRAAAEQGVRLAGKGFGSSAGQDTDLWSLVWADEFEGSSLDPKKWEHEENCWGGGNGELQCYTAREKNSFVRNSALHIVAHKEYYTGRDGYDGSGGYRTMPYTSARLRSIGAGSFRYARVCARAKLPMGQGVWPAIWMLPSHWTYGAWPQSGEIDIMEARSLSPHTDTEIFGTLHFGGAIEKGRWVYQSRRHVIPAVHHPAHNFHTYCVIRDFDEMHWEIDSVPYGPPLTQWFSESDAGRAPFPAPFDQDFHILLNVAVGGNFAGSPNEHTLAYPEAMVIDWVRVHTCKLNPLKPSQCMASKWRGA